MARTRSSGSGSPLLALASIVVAIAALHLAKEILVPLALAIFLSFLLTPLADRLEGWGLGRIPSVISVVAVTFVILGFLGWIVTSQLVDLSVQLPDWKDEIIDKIQELKPDSAVLDKVTQTIDEVTRRSARRSLQSPKSQTAAGSKRQWTRRPLVRAGEPIESGTGLLDRLTRQIKVAGEQEPMDVRVVGLPPSPLEQIRELARPHRRAALGSRHRRRARHLYPSQARRPAESPPAAVRRLQSPCLDGSADRRYRPGEQVSADAVSHQRRLRHLRGSRAGRDRRAQRDHLGRAELLAPILAVHRPVALGDHAAGRVVR